MSWAEDQAEFMRAGGQTVGVRNNEQLEQYLKHLEEESHETLYDAIDDTDLLDGLVDTIVVSIGAIHSLGVDPELAWNAVHRANMRKVVDKKVFRRPDGPIGKPPGWFGPEKDLKELLANVRESA